MSQTFLKLTRDSFGGELELWRPPHPEGYYVIGADPTLARDHSKSPDEAALVVGERLPGQRLEQVAQWVGLLQPNEFGRLIARLGWWYNGALVNCEDNIAEGVKRGLDAEEYDKARWYVHRQDNIKEGDATRYFFYKHYNTQAQLFETIIEQVTTDRLVVRSRRLLSEMETVRETKLRTGRVTVDTGGKDLTVALLMMCIAHENGPMIRRDLHQEEESPAEEFPPEGVDVEAWREKRGLNRSAADDWGDLGGAPEWNRADTSTIPS